VIFAGGQHIAYFFALYDLSQIGFDLRNVSNLYLLSQAPLKVGMLLKFFNFRGVLICFPTHACPGASGSFCLILA